METTVWFNPRCSKCRGAEELLIDKGIKPELIHYLDQPPAREELERVLDLLGLTNDPLGMMRMGEPEARHLAYATREELIDAMIAHPILIERPIVIRGSRAVIARPPELLLDILDQQA